MELKRVRSRQSDVAVWRPNGYTGSAQLGDGHCHIDKLDQASAHKFVLIDVHPYSSSWFRFQGLATQIQHAKDPILYVHYFRFLYFAPAELRRDPD